MKIFVKIQYLFIGVAILVSALVAIRRMLCEMKFKEVSLAIDYKEIKALGLEYGVGEKDIFKVFREAGVSSVVIHEDTLKSLHKEGHISVFSTTELMERERLDRFTGFSVHRRFLKTLLEKDTTYILTKNKAIFRHLHEVLSYKISLPISVGRERGLWVIEVKGGGERLVGMGMGFLPLKLKYLSRLGFEIIAVPNNHGSPTSESITKTLTDIHKRWGVKKLLFIDEVLGYPDHTMTTLTIIKDYGLGVLVLEKEGVAGIREVSQSVPQLVVRTHMSLKEDIKELVQAVEKRNVRCLYLHPVRRGHNPLGLNIEYIESLKKILNDKGFRIGTCNAFPEKRISPIVPLIIKIGILFTLILLLDKLFSLTFGQKILLAVVGVVVGCVGFGKEVFFQKFWALTICLLFPTFAILLIEKRQDQLLPLLKEIFMVCGLTALGALFIVGLMNEAAYLLKIREVWGGNLTFSPVLGVWLFLKAKEEGVGNLLFSIIHGHQPIKLFLLLGFIVFLFGGFGNVVLKYQNLIGSLVGYPALFFGVHLWKRGYREGVLLSLATLSQVSLITTYYLHLYTPLLLCIRRSVTDFIIGGLIGCLLIIAEGSIKE